MTIAILRDPSVARLPGGITRRVFDGSVQFIPEYLMHDPKVANWDYGVFKFPFVPGFHVCFMDDSDRFADTQEIILSSHKTLHEAMAVCRLLLANGGIKYV